MSVRPSKPFLALCLILVGMTAVALAATSPWQLTPTPSPGERSQLRGIDALSTDEAWTVGWTETLDASLSLALRWNGTSWTQVPTPSPSLYSGPGGTAVFLEDVKIISSDDVWAVGSYQTVHKGDGFPGFQAFTLHWDGTRWSHVEAPQTPVGSTGGRLRGVDALSSGDVWAVGTRPGADGRVREYGLVLRWDGTRWVELPPTPPITKGDHQLYRVSALAPDQVWIAGGYSPDTGGSETGRYVNRWTGSGWEVHTNIPMHGLESYLEDIVAIAPDDVWAVGYTNLDGYSSEPYIVHYDGAGWQLVRPAFDHEHGWLMGITALAADDIWAAGTYSDADGLQRPLLLHYDGTSWTEVPADPNGPENAWFRNITAYRDAEGSPQAWAAGGRDAIDTHAQRLREGGTPPPPPPTVLRSVTFNPVSLTGGKPSTGTVTLNAPAPAGGLKVILASADTAVATIPASVTVEQGSLSKTFTVTTKPVRTATTLGLSASIPGETRTGSLTVLPPVLTKLSLNMTNFAGGCRTATGRITLDGKAPAGGLSIVLANTNPAANVPAKITVPAGYNTATFTVTTSAVSSLQTGTVTATLDGVSKPVTLNLRPIGVPSWPSPPIRSPVLAPSPAP